MLKINSAVPGNRQIISVGYKYNTRNIVSFVATEDSGITKYDIHYISK